MKKKREREEELEELRVELIQEKNRVRLLEEILHFRNMDEEVEPRIKLQEQGPKRSELWSKISHEILTPMDAILGMTDLVLGTDLTEEQQRYIEMIQTSADRLFGVISDVLDYSELQEQTLRCDMGIFDLAQALEYDLYVADLSCKHKDLSFTQDLATNLPEEIQGDQQRIRQVLNTLLSFVIKNTKQGEVHLSIGRKEDDEKGRLVLLFTIESSGSGLQGKTLQSLFYKPAAPEMSGGEEKFSEMGLSLVVATRLVQLFGGEMGGTVERDRTRCWFTWPVVEHVIQERVEKPSLPVEEGRVGGKRLQGIEVLLAEDEHINASITSAFLELEGARVTVVENGRQAIAKASERQFNAILMDVEMPEVDGLEATRVIRRSERKNARKTPIIALTAHGQKRDREKCLRAGMDDYIAKPLDKHLLYQMLLHYMTPMALVVATDSKMQHDILQPLVANGWSVCLAETGQMALYEFSLRHVDMVLLDASLPPEDGVKTVQTLRKLEQFSGGRARIIGVNFSPEKEYADYAQCGLDSFCDLQTMVKEVNTTL